MHKITLRPVVELESHRSYGSKMRHIRTVLKECCVDKSGLSAAEIFLTTVTLARELHLYKKLQIRGECSKEAAVEVMQLLQLNTVFLNIPELPLVLLCNVSRATT